jgi:hypothetical protein
MSDVAPEPVPPVDAAGSDNIITRFFTFDRLIGGALIKVLYYVGLAAVALWVLFALAAAINLSRYSSDGALWGVLIALIGGVAWVVVWRFVCELWLIIFQIYNRLGEIRDRLPPL